MKKADFIRNVVEVAKEREIEVSQVVVRELMEVMETVIDTVLVDGDEVVVFNTKFGMKEQAARQGVSKMKDVEVEWSTPKMSIPFAKIMKSKKDRLSIEI